jgi:hypothetical protein
MKEIYVKLSPDERQLYKAVEDRARIEINRYLREGVVMKNYSCILAMLVRLRQVFFPHVTYSNYSSVSIHT